MPASSIVLIDDGTLDTVLECVHCRTQIRYTPDPPLDDHDAHCDDSCECQDAVIEWALVDAQDTHECPR